MAYGFEHRNEDGDSYADIPQNRTLIAGQFTSDEPVLPAVVHQLQNIDDVFRHYQPTLPVSFEDPEGSVHREQLSFRSVEDFSVESLSRQSRFLSATLRERDQFLAIARQLRSSPALNEVLKAPGAKAALLGAIQAMISELKQYP